MRALLLTLLLAGTVLAGCTDDPATDPATEPDHQTPDDTTLKAGKGAIAGLLIDDRFRPIAGGGVLLQEAGASTSSNGNGEFSFVDLEPGTYTLRVTAQGHEAAPATVRVEEGLWAEANIEARRAVSEGSFIITQEYTAFIPCAFQVVVETAVGDCTADQSGDSSRQRFYTDLSAFGANITHVAREMLSSHVGDYSLQVGWGEVETLVYGYYTVRDFYGTDYARIDLTHNETSPGDISFFGAGVPMDPWLNDRAFHTTVFLYGEGAEELRGALPGTYPFTGVGVDLGVKMKFIQSAFVGEPDVDVEAYCLLCS